MSSSQRKRKPKKARPEGEKDPKPTIIKRTHKYIVCNCNDETRWEGDSPAMREHLLAEHHDEIPALDPCECGYFTIQPSNCQVHKAGAPKTCKNWKAQGSPRYVPRVQPDVSGVRDRGSVQDKIPHLPGSRLGSVRYTDSVRGARTEDVTAVGRGQSMAVDTQLEPSSCTIRSSAAPSSVHGGSSLASNRRLDANGHQGEFVSWVQAGPTQSTSQRAPPSHARRTHDDLFAARRLHTPYSRPRGSSSFPYHPFEAHDSPSDTQTQRESIASSSSHVFPGTPDCEIPMSVAQATVANWYFPPPEEIERLIIDAQRQMQPNNRSQQS